MMLGIIATTIVALNIGVSERARKMQNPRYLIGALSQGEEQQSTPNLGLATTTTTTTMTRTPSIDEGESQEEQLILPSMQNK
jgi:hypothetical protein